MYSATVAAADPTTINNGNNNFDFNQNSKYHRK